jgi:AcrR family transcriptional regulator
VEKIVVDNSEPRKHLPADERKAIIVETVVQLASARNPSDITTAAIANEMKLTQGALFRHFPSKEAIWEAVAEWVSDTMIERIGRATDSVASPMAALEAMFASHIEFVCLHPGVPRMIFGELQQAQPTAAKRVIEALMQKYRARLRRLLDSAKQQREMPQSVDTEAASILFIGMVQGLVMQSMLAGDVKRIQRDAPRVFAIFRQGIGAER